MKYKLIALDVDGTLLNDEHAITERTKRTVLDVHRAGAMIVLCTGRGPGSTFPVLEELGLEGTIITHNGAATVQAAGRTIVHQFPFYMNDVLPLVRYCRENNIHFDICTPFDMFVERMGEEERRMYDKYFADPIWIPDIAQLEEPLVKLTAFGPKEVLDRVEEDWKRIEFPLRYIRSGDLFIDVMHPSASKGNALEQLARLWNIRRSEIIAIGNYYNDVDMLRFAGLGIAMGNSPDEVKRAADAVTLSNNEEGVHAALAAYCFGN